MTMRFRRLFVMPAAWRCSTAYAIGARTPVYSFTPSTFYPGNGKDLRREPIEHRKAALARLIRPHPGIGLLSTWNLMMAQ